MICVHTSEYDNSFSTLLFTIALVLLSRKGYGCARYRRLPTSQSTIMTIATTTGTKRFRHAAFCPLLTMVG